MKIIIKEIASNPVVIVTTGTVSEGRQLAKKCGIRRYEMYLSSAAPCKKQK